MRQIRASGAYLDDPEVNDYLNDIGHRLVAAQPDSPWDFEFFAIADPGINAFALPGGFVGVNTGLILMTQTESELASVLAHEITHVTQHHFTRAMAAQQTFAAVYARRARGCDRCRKLQVVVGGTGGNAGDRLGAGDRDPEPAQLHARERIRSRSHRLPAARRSLDSTSPRWRRMFQRLQKQSRFSDGNAPSYLRTHPITTERIADAQARADKEPYRQVPDSLDFQMVRALLRSYQGTPREAVLFFDNALAEHKYNSEIAERYGLVASLLRADES